MRIATSIVAAHERAEKATPVAARGVNATRHTHAHSMGGRRGAAAQCGWQDRGSTLVVYLSAASKVAPGASVGVRTAAIWPQEWRGGCEVDGGGVSMCASGRRKTPT